MVYAGTAKSSDCTLILTEGAPLSLPQHAANPHISISTYNVHIRDLRIPVVFVSD